MFAYPAPQVADSLPELLEDIQYQLLDLLSLVLSKRPFNSSTTQVGDGPCR